MMPSAERCEFRFRKGDVKIGDMRLARGKRVTRCGDILGTRTFAREVRVSLGLLVMCVGRLQILLTRAGPKLGKTLAGRLSFLRGRVAFVPIAVELHP